ncbi:hypothetical protein AB0G04_35615 [Actinoplanes sp. NPDC023801]|uniref:VHL beta domain-containing protein n=1 Tax=Actinoplanes sp. NPDC023801 TaxID=3154595 RepID=UPI0033FFED13
MTSADDSPSNTGLRIGRWVPDPADMTSRHGVRRHPGHLASVRHDPAEQAPAPERAPGPSPRSRRLPRRRRRLLAMGLAGVVSAGSVASLLRPAPEPAELNADSSAVGVTDPGRPEPDSTAPVSFMPAPPSSSAALPSYPPSRKLPSTPRPTASSAHPTMTTPPARVTVLSAHREKDLRSIQTQKSTEIDFVNRRDESVVIYWLDYHGTRERYVVLESGDTREQPTFVGHPWVVTTLRGHGLGVFLPATRPAQATIT